MNTKLLSQRYVRLLLLIFGIALCLWTIKTAAWFGASRFLVRTATVLQNLSAAQTAVSLTPDDAQAHRINAALLSQVDANAETVMALEQGLALRPADYSLWLALGLMRDKMGDTTGALAALDEAVIRAPYYAHPRWQRGNVLLRAGQYEAAFSDLNIAAQSNPELVPNIIDLAWGITRGDSRLTQELVDLKGDKSRLIFARFLANHGKPLEAIEQSRVAGNLDENERRELVKHLLDKRAFAEAFQIWSASHADSAAKTTTFVDGGFEGALSTNEIGFGWRLPNTKSVRLSVDPNQPHSGAKSLRIEFAGESANSVVLSQLLVVQPSTRYRIDFAGRSEEIVTGGRPIVAVSDAGENGSNLGKSAELDKGTSGWRTFSFEFASTPKTQAVSVVVTRESCSTPPCPIFGSIGLDSFSIEQLKP